jgi:hypothetical protein
MDCSEIYKNTNDRYCVWSYRDLGRGLTGILGGSYRDLGWVLQGSWVGLTGILGGILQGVLWWVLQGSCVRSYRDLE